MVGEAVLLAGVGRRVRNDLVGEVLGSMEGRKVVDAGCLEGKCDWLGEIVLWTEGARVDRRTKVGMNEGLLLGRFVLNTFGDTEGR